MIDEKTQPDGPDQLVQLVNQSCVWYNGAVKSTHKKGNKEIMHTVYLVMKIISLHETSIVQVAGEGNLGQGSGTNRGQQ